jgi:hypothetical protein
VLNVGLRYVQQLIDRLEALSAGNDAVPDEMIQEALASIAAPDFEEIALQSMHLAPEPAGRSSRPQRASAAAATASFSAYAAAAAASAPPVPSGSSVSQWRFARDLLSDMKEDQHMQLFRIPVDPVRDMAPDYLTVIGRPMDLRTLGENLSADLYPSGSDFFRDCLLMFTNAMTYNAARHPVHIQAKRLMTKYQRRWNKGYPTATVTDTRVPYTAALNAPVPPPPPAASPPLTPDDLSEVASSLPASAAPGAVLAPGGTSAFPPPPEAFSFDDRVSLHTALQAIDAATNSKSTDRILALVEDFARRSAAQINLQDGLDIGTLPDAVLALVYTAVCCLCLETPGLETALPRCTGGEAGADAADEETPSATAADSLQQPFEAPNELSDRAASELSGSAPEAAPLK